MVRCAIWIHRGGEELAEKEGLLPFKLIEDESGEALTSHGGLPLVVETCEALGFGGLVKQQVRIKQRNRGYMESKYVESVIALMVAGGDCLEDIERLSSDAGLKLSTLRLRTPGVSPGVKASEG